MYDSLDVDECAEGHVDCNPETSICQNTLGGFVCHCKTGYERKPGEHQCTGNFVIQSMLSYLCIYN